MHTQENIQVHHVSNLKFNIFEILKLQMLEETNLKTER